MHPTYLLSAAMLTLAFMAALWAEGQARQSVKLAVWTLVLVLPATVYVLVQFAPTSATTYAQAQSELVNLRIPHHSRPDLWFDRVAAIQVGWVLLAFLLAGKGRLRFVLGIPFLLALVLTLVQVATGSNTLALLFPWRISSVLVPIATAVILARLSAIPASSLEVVAGGVLSVLLTAGLVAGGVWISVKGLAFYTSAEELPLLKFVHDNKVAGDVYFVPVPVPLPELAKTTRGSLSSDFKPLPDKKIDRRIIPGDLLRFRLHTGAPIFVDFKSVPYKDTEVLEWRDRLDAAVAIQKQLRTGQVQEALAELRKRGVTHLVVPGGQEVRGEVEQVYKDAHYRVYRLRNRDRLPR
jgi:hypothetical protein